MALDLRSLLALARAALDEAARHIGGTRMPEDVTLRVVDGEKR